MKVNLEKNYLGEWQADIIMPDGSDHHAVGREPGDALIELGVYIKSRRKPSDIETLARIMIETREAQSDG